MAERPKAPALDMCQFGGEGSYLTSDENIFGYYFQPFWHIFDIITVSEYQDV